MFIANLINICIILFLGIIYFYKKKFQYWKIRKVPNLPPKIPFGNAPSLFGKTSFQEVLSNHYQHFKKLGKKHFGIYSFFQPLYIPIDLELIKNILTKDFHYFSSRGLYYNEKSDPISAHLVAVDGELWRNTRVKLTPTFTSGKMKNMFKIFVECANQMNEAINKMVENSEDMDVKDVVGCYTTDVIGNCAFGLNCNSFEDKNSEFRYYGKKAFKPSLRGTVVRIFVSLFRNFARKIGVRSVDPKISKFYTKIIKETVHFREKNQINRNDFLQILIDLKNKDEGITIDTITANSFVFFLAGFDTSATTMNFALYQLSKNEDIQEKARRQIKEVLSKNNGQLTYESLKEITYLDQIIDETLRTYGPAPLTSRECTQNYQIPDTDVIIEKGTRVLIPLYLLHMDGEYFDNPKEFSPDRFSPENKKTIRPYTFMPFGEGPRNCIGLRFGLMQTKIGLTLLLKNFKFTLSPKTVEPLVFNKRTIILTPVNPIYLNVDRAI